MFGAVTLTKQDDFDEYKYSGYGIGFDRKGKFSVDNGFGRSCIIFGVDRSSCVRVDNKKNDILIRGEGITQGLDGATLTAEKMYSVSFTENNKKIVSACVIMGLIVIYLLMLKKLLNLKQKILKLRQVYYV